MSKLKRDEVLFICRGTEKRTLFLVLIVVRDASRMGAVSERKLEPVEAIIAWADWERACREGVDVCIVEMDSSCVWPLGE